MSEPLTGFTLLRFYYREQIFTGQNGKKHFRTLFILYFLAIAMVRFYLIVVRVSAANTLLDRAYGKPAVKEERELVDLPPVVIQLTGSAT